MLYLAKKQGSFNIQTRHYVGNTAYNINHALANMYLKWETSDLYQEYVDNGMTEYYDDALHTYTITPKGEVLLSIYRLTYAVKQNMQSKIQSRGEEYLKLLEVNGFTYHDFEDKLTNSEKKSIKKFHELFSTSAVISTFDNEKPTPQKTEEDISLSVLFKFSCDLGPKGTDASRTNDYVFKKCMEELGEMALEDQIANGLSYKDAGSDGVKGEAVDLAICAMDMFVLQCNPSMTPEEIEREFLMYMNKKLNKWKKSIGWENE